MRTIWLPNPLNGLIRRKYFYLKSCFGVLSGICSVQLDRSAAAHSIAECIILLSKMQFYNFTARKAGDETIPGTYLQAFIKSGQDYLIAEIKIYKDGVIDCYEKVDLEGFKEKVRTGRVTTRVPEGARVSMMNSGKAFTFTVTDVKAWVEEEEFVKQVEDEIRRLNGQPTTHELCQKAMNRYGQAPTEENKEQLRQSYEAVPKHLRALLGDTDSKDWDYLDVLGIT